MSLIRQFDRLVDLKEEVKIHVAEVHFGGQILSPVKNARSGVEYYNAQVNDGSMTFQLVVRITT